jgi:hypothetical protein
LAKSFFFREKKALGEKESNLEKVFTPKETTFVSPF